MSRRRSLVLGKRRGKERREKTEVGEKKKGWLY